MIPAILPCKIHNTQELPVVIHSQNVGVLLLSLSIPVFRSPEFHGSELAQLNLPICPLVTFRTTRAVVSSLYLCTINASISTAVML
jgi:hypothetical protein